MRAHTHPHQEEDDITIDPTTPSAAQVTPAHSRVRIYGKRSNPEWGVLVAETTPEEELVALVDRAVRTYALLGTRLAALTEPE